MTDSNQPPGAPSNTPPSPPGGSSSGDRPGAPPPPPSGPAGGGGTPPPPPAGGGTAGGPPPAGGTESPNRGLMIVLSYLWLLALIPLLTEKDDKEVQWHAKHGLVLMVAEIIGVIILTIIGSAIAFIDLGCSGCILQTVFWVVVLVVHVLCIMKGVNGERFQIPGITPFVDKF